MADDGIDLAFNSWQVEIDEARAEFDREVKKLKDEAAGPSVPVKIVDRGEANVRTGTLYRKVNEIDRRMTALEEFVRVIVERGSI